MTERILKPKLPHGDMERYITDLIPDLIPSMRMRWRWSRLRRLFTGLGGALPPLPSSIVEGVVQRGFSGYHLQLFERYKYFL